MEMPMFHDEGIEYVDEGAEWTDLVDGNGTADANGTVNENMPGTYLITYTFTDSVGIMQTRWCARSG